MVLTILIKSLRSSFILLEKGVYSAIEMNAVSFKRANQYSVSLASFKAIFILFKKSFLLCACSASRINVPTAVPLRSNCLDKTNSFLSEDKCLYKPIISKAKE